MYNYTTQRPYIFTEEGQQDLFTVLRNINFLKNYTHVATTSDLTKGILGDEWNTFAIVDYLEEMNYINEVKLKDTPFIQNRIYKIN